MLWVRSWPARPPAGRPHVVDSLERLVIDDYDYTTAGELGADLVVVEWDVAVDPADAAVFSRRCAADPGRVRVGAYRLHDQPGTRWAHRRLVAGHEERWVDRSDGWCDYFGFGLVYLPARWLAGFLEADSPERGRPAWARPGLYHDGRLTDQTFSTWLRHRSDHGRVPIDWDVAAVHLHAG